MDEIISQAKKYALDEIEKYGTPAPPHLDLATAVAARLANVLGANVDIVQIGTYLMDLKLGEAAQAGKLVEHARLSAEAARDFLAQFNLTNEISEQIVNCVEAHHGDLPYKSLEAEICANADCYRFLHPRGFLVALAFLGKRYADFDECLDFIEKKLEEKHSILSLDTCKAELEPHYQKLKEQIAQARQRE
ncbi:MAG: hypothetical protein V1826_02735 [bacterium]